MIFWVTSIAVSVSLLVITAAMKSANPQMAYAHMAIAAVMAIVFALVAIRDTRQLAEAGGSRAAVAAQTARFMGYVWTWGALALVISYGSGVVSWHEWLTFFIAFAILAAASLFFSMLLQRDADQGKEDEALLKVGRYLAWAQFFGMIVVVIGFIIDGKMTRFLVPRYGDWAANNIFFFGAIALAAISAYALKVGKPSAQAE
jgi:uncharacterized membrane protein